jgi:hypothetical protein
VIALPANSAFALLLFFVLADGLSLEARAGISVAVILATEAFCPIVVWLQRLLTQRWHPRQDKPKRNKPKRALFGTHAFDGPYRAFLQKDIHALRKPASLANSAVAVVFGLVIMFASSLVGWQSFAVCLYIGMLLPVTVVSMALYESEVSAYRIYYLQQLRLRNEQLVLYKLPLQIVMVVLATVIYVTFSSLLHGFMWESLPVALGCMVYFGALCLSVSWWYARRLQKGGDFNSIYTLASFIVFAIPCVVLVYAIILFAQTRLRVKGVRHA